MKQIFESPETFEAYATIDAGLFMLSDLHENIRNLSHEEMKDRMIAIYEDIIEAKKIIEADYSLEQSMLETLNKS